MRNKIQKYLSGEKEGFSLVELIIVIAIMAILIGVVALAVIPYLNKSKESKDLAMLDTVCSALTTGVATTQVTGEGTITINGGEFTTTTDDEGKVADAMKEVLGNQSLELQSTAAKEVGTITCTYNGTVATVEVVDAETSDGQAFKVTNGGTAE